MKIVRCQETIDGRRGFTYTVQTSACAFDDPHDGTGTFDTSSVVACSGSTSGTTDSNPFDYARVSVVVSWTDEPGISTRNPGGR